MKRDNHSSRFRRRRIPSAEDLERWSPSSGPACTAKKFMPNLSGTAGSPWNASVANVFADHFIAFGQYQCNNKGQIAKAFTSHLRDLIRKYKLQCSQPSPAQTLATKQSHSRYQRKNGVCDILVPYIFINYMAVLLRSFTNGVCKPAPVRLSYGAMLQCSACWGPMV